MDSMPPASMVLALTYPVVFLTKEPDAHPEHVLTTAELQ